jgi:glycosyltransferase involved in cell wall biosynthesis
MTQVNTETPLPLTEPAPTKPEPAKPYRNGFVTLPAAEPPHAERRLAPGKRVLALFCHEEPGSFIGQYTGQVARALAQRQHQVHLFSRHAFDLPVPGLTIHRLGETTGAGLVEQVEEYSQRATQAFLARFPASAGPITLLGFEWSSIPALRQIQEARQSDVLLSLHSLERQRSDLASDLSQRIHAMELDGLARARQVLIHQSTTGDVARAHVPACAARLVHACEPFPSQHFEAPVDPGRIKERVQVGPIDPMILFLGDLDHRHGPDVLMKSVPAILKNHKQARFVWVGCGELYWPLRVHARYLLLEHAIRLPGSLTDQPLYEMIQAADVIVAPSREVTMWWPVQAAWAAGRPVVASHELGKAMQLRHEEDSVLIYPHESSCTWGVERLLFDPELREKLGQTGRRQLAERFGWGRVATQIEELIGAKA